MAIKKLKNFNMKDKHMVEEFRREAKLAELVHNHPNIVKARHTSHTHHTSWLS